MDEHRPGVYGGGGGVLPLLLRRRRRHNNVQHLQEHNERAGRQQTPAVLPDILLGLKRAARSAVHSRFPLGGMVRGGRHNHFAGGKLRIVPHPALQKRHGVSAQIEEARLRYPHIEGDNPLRPARGHTELRNRDSQRNSAGQHQHLQEGRDGRLRHLRQGGGIRLPAHQQLHNGDNHLRGAEPRRGRIRKGQARLAVRHTDQRHNGGDDRSRHLALRPELNKILRQRRAGDRRQGRAARHRPGADRGVFLLPAGVFALGRGGVPRRGQGLRAYARHAHSLVRIAHSVH